MRPIPTHLFPSLLLIFLSSCAPAPQLGTWNGPRAPIMLSTEGWNFDGQPARILHTAHYDIHTTMADNFPDSVAQVLEGALEQYRRIAPGVSPTNRPMDCYIFRYRNEWADFTERHTGADAPVYLQITRGGYTVHDWFVSYYLGDTPTWSVTAHEGWHQYVARHFKGRLPPFLEEGIACMFENVQWTNNLPRWNLSINTNRTTKLRLAIEARELWPLEDLIQMHAGEVVDLSPERIEAFYAQNWAFAKFLWESNDGRFRPALQRLLAETAAGAVFDPTHSLQHASLPWRPAGVKPMLEHYLDLPFDQIDRLYTAYLMRIAYTDYNAQWTS